jgi:hypothetical protein
MSAFLNFKFLFLAKFWAVKKKKKKRKRKKKGRSVLDQSHGQADLSFDALLFLDQEI